jgi:hypothetical protein
MKFRLGSSRLAALAGGVGLNLSQGQVGDVAHQGLEAFVLAYPLLDLGQQILGDINRAGFAFYFVGQVMGQMAFTGLAVATGPAAFSSEGDQTGGDKRALGLELLEPGVEVTADQGGVFWNLHSEPGIYQN